MVQSDAEMTRRSLRVEACCKAAGIDASSDDVPDTIAAWKPVIARPRASEALPELWPAPAIKKIDVLLELVPTGCFAPSSTSRTSRSAVKV